MNFRIIAYIVGWVCNFQAIFMVLPCITALVYQEHEFFAFLISMILCLIAGIPLTARKPKNKVFYTKDGCVAVALSWLALCIFGSVPFVLSDSIPHPIDAFFETVSGFTTTGSSILTDVEVLPHCILMWRSFTHWIGGMGVLVFLLSLLPLAGGYHMNLMKAESPGPSVSKLVPKVQQTAKILYSIYIGMTLLQIVLLLIGNIPLFDTLCIAFGTAGTGGFGIKNDSMASYSPYIQNVCTVFMLLFGVNFSCYYLLLVRHFKTVFKDQELRMYIAIVLGSIVLITWNLHGFYSTLGETVRHAAFQVATVITTTGFATTDFDLWPSFSKGILLALMFLGACAGSTGGGLKIGRTLLLLKNLRRKTRRILNPKRVEVVRVNGQKVSESVLENTNTYLIAYVVIVLGSFLLISIDNLSMMTNFSAVVACFNNIGPGFDAVGPTCNFSVFSGFSKVVLIFDMLAGRLEIFPILILASKSTWSRK